MAPGNQAPWSKFVRKKYRKLSEICISDKQAIICQREGVPNISNTLANYWLFIWKSNLKIKFHRESCVCICWVWQADLGGGWQGEEHDRRGARSSCPQSTRRSHVCTHHIGIGTDRLHFSLPAAPERNRSSCWQTQSCPWCAEGPSLNRTPQPRGCCHSEPGHPPGRATGSRSRWPASSWSQVGTEVFPQTPASVPGSPGPRPAGQMSSRTGTGIISNTQSVCSPEVDFKHSYGGWDEIRAIRKGKG